MNAALAEVELLHGEDVWIGRFRAMGGPCEVLVETERESVARALTARVGECAARIERKFSRYRKDNIVARINGAHGTAVEVDEETANLLDYADLVHRLSDGMFDITSGVLRRAWSFDGGVRVPTAAEIKRLLPLIGWPKAQWERPVLRLLPGMQIDFGGIGKEYAVDQAAQTLARISDAPVLVNFGGDLAATRARAGDRPWRVGIENVAQAGQRRHAARLIELHAGALATSGDTHRFVTANGERLPHILDPRDGFPVRGAPRSVTVAAPTCTNAGMLTTLAMLRGTGAEDFLAAEGVRHWIQR
jgi:thiamine biosynthesis lipoprotein